MSKNISMNERNANNINQKLETLNRNYMLEITSRKKGSARRAYKMQMQAFKLDSELQEIYKQSQPQTDIETVSICIAIHSLKVLARGRKLDNGKFTPGNEQASKLLQAGRNDATGIIEDLIQAVTLKVWEYLANGNITIIKEDDFPRIKLIDENDDKTMREILNVVQSEFYRNQQRHYKREYRPLMVEDEEGNLQEDHQLVTAAMREWEKSIEYIGKDELMESLIIQLTEREKEILHSKLEQKQVLRSYSNNGVSEKRYVTRYKTLDEIAEETGCTKMQVRTALNNIKVKCKNLLEK